MHLASAFAARSIPEVGSVQHNIPIDRLGAAGAGMARAVTTCVHCGFCLAACPTYRVMGEEMDSPRGRIMLMKQVLEGSLEMEEALPYVDRCLGCLACETACPSGVRYRELLVPFRARGEHEARPAASRWVRGQLLSVLESPAMFRLAVTAGRWGRAVSGVLPNQLRHMLDLVPRAVPPAEELPSLVPALGARRARVGLLSGCVQRVLRPSINTATLRCLSANGVEVVVPRAQGCCGALAAHSGFEERGAALARDNARIFPADIDAVITNAAGCGSHMKDGAFGAARVADVSEFLDALGMRTPLALPAPMTVAYHDACHLSHAQGVRAAPRRLLALVANLTVRELSDPDTCCGSAGLYNLEHPETAAELGRMKARDIDATGADAVVSGNIGCLTQLATHLAASRSIPVLHTIELLNSAYSAQA
jgi:glycolate oxidase iron-sulfur subunit